MVLQFAFHIILILCFMHTLASAQYRIAKAGCDSTCGGVDIPYPFGMNDPKCYAGTWFEIECRNTSDQAQTPYLKSIDVEVKHIDVGDATIAIMNPIYRWNCGDLKDAQQFVDLRGSPFVYSQLENKFVAVGCNKMAFLMSNGTEVSVCVSICDDKENVDLDLATDRCNGKSCCETSLPLYLSEYNVTTGNLGNNRVSDQCNYALIVAEDYVYQYVRPFPDLKYAIAMLDWEIIPEIILNSTVKLPANCKKTNVTSSQYDHSGWTCHCDFGYDGNPYIDGGCIMRDTELYFHHKRSRAKWAIVGFFYLRLYRMIVVSLTYNFFIGMVWVHMHILFYLGVVLWQWTIFAENPQYLKLMGEVGGITYFLIWLFV